MLCLGAKGWTQNQSPRQTLRFLEQHDYEPKCEPKIEVGLHVLTSAYSCLAVPVLCGKSLKMQAVPWHGRGHRFDPDQVHQQPFQYHPFTDTTRPPPEGPRVRKGAEIF